MREEMNTEYLVFEAEESAALSATISKIYYIFYNVDLKQDRFTKYHATKMVSDFTDRFTSAYECLQAIAKNLFVPEQFSVVSDFYDSNTWQNRLREKNTVYLDAKGVLTGWIRTNLIVADRDEEGLAYHVIVAIQNINETKLKEIAQTMQLEKQLREITALNAELEKTKAQLETLSARQKVQLDMDGLTQLFNRRAYEVAMNHTRLEDNLVYIAFDVNGLKQTNDHLGHAAGDELLMGTATCISSSFGAYGRVYRTGGDEFAAILHMDVEELGQCREHFEEMVSAWTGNAVHQLHIAAGYAVCWAQPECHSLQELAMLADKRMYEDKSAYYKQNAMDRRKN